MSGQSGLAAALAAAGQERAVLPSGLTVLVRCLPERSTVCAVCAVGFGSVDTRFALDGAVHALPEGTAHYLEHKKFESAAGDAFMQFAALGADADAYTSYDRTAYTVSATQQVEESLAVLLKMLQTPYFTAKTIAKERGIIEQEIQMYVDNPEWRLITGLCQCLYHSHAVRGDIAGTVQSIRAVTPELLYRSYEAFYRPENMVLAVAGPITMEQVLGVCARAEADKPRPAVAVQRLLPEEPLAVCCPKRVERMAVAKPCFGLGFKEEPLPAAQRLRGELLYDLLCECICGGMTPLYRRLYDEGLVNPGFDGMVLALEGCCCILFTGESEDPDRVEALLWQEIERIRTEGVEEALFARCKKMKYGELLDALDNAEDSASMMADLALRGHTVAQQLELLGSLTKQQADEAMQRLFRRERSAQLRILPGAS